jgi:hypothetical protein
MDIRTYTITDAAGVGKFRAVVQDTAEGKVKKPAAANAPGFVGISQEAQGTQNGKLAIKEGGRTRAIAGGIIDVGDLVKIGDNTGKLVSAQAAIAAHPGAASIQYVVGQARSAAGADGDEFWLQIRPQVVTIAAT